jgi:dTDP-glucose 4,6-dehydratase
VSTDEVYGHIKEGRNRETDPLLPRSPYAATKAAAEMLVWSYHSSFNLPVVISRGANSYGPYQFPEKIVPLFITNALQDLPLPLYGKGTAVRDYVYVDDHVEALARILWKGEPGEAYNVGGGSEVSGVQVADSVLSLTGKPGSLRHFVQDRPGHDYRYALETSRMRRLGWQAQTSFKDGMRLTVEWYRRHEDWWRRRKSPEFWDFYRRNYRGLPANAIPG